MQLLGQPISWSRTLKKLPKFNGKIDPTLPLDTQRSPPQAITELSEKVRNAVNHQEWIELPIIAYFSTQRLFSQRTNADWVVLDGRYAGYYNAFSATNIRKQTELWFEKAEYEQYQQRRTKPDFQDEALESIRILILQHFEEWQHIYYLKLPSETGMNSCLYIEQKNGQVIPDLYRKKCYGIGTIWTIGSRHYFVCGAVRSNFLYIHNIELFFNQ